MVQLGRLSRVRDPILDVVLLITIILSIRAISDLDIALYLAVFIAGDGSDYRVCPPFDLFLDTFLLIAVHRVLRGSYVNRRCVLRCPKRSS
jgi:hypothetical protein